MTKTKNDNIPTALTVDELAERWHCARNTVTAAIREGKLVAFKLGKRTYRVSLDEVLRFEKTRAA